MEYRDLYNKNRELTGKTITKDESIPNGSYIIVCMIMIQNSKGEYLVQKRSQIKNGKYAFTGGHAKTGENGIQAIISEVSEEIGIKLEENEIRQLYTHRYDNQQVFHDLFYTKKDFEISDLTLQEEEVESAMWCSVDEIKKFIEKDQFFNCHIEELYRTIRILNGSTE